jgi:hypothetical protein
MPDSTREVGLGEAGRYGVWMLAHPGISLLAGSLVPFVRRSMTYVRSAPATYGYLAILLLTGGIIARLSDPVADRLLLAQSTNLHHLSHDPLRVLLSSAFWAPGTNDLLTSAILFTLVLAAVERRIGSRRTVGVFAIGHIGATLIIAAGLWVALHLGAVERSVVDVRDVGTSYGFFAVAAAMTFLLARALRAPYALALVAYLGTTAVLSGSFGDFGHLVAAALGFAAYPVVRHATGPIASPILTGLSRRRAAPMGPIAPVGGTER